MTASHGAPLERKAVIQPYSINMTLRWSENQKASNTQEMRHLVILGTLDT